MHALLIATTNRHKVEEYQALFADVPYCILSLPDVNLAHMDVEETGTTFEENSRIKALAYARASGLPVLADDSGLEIDALNGAPGVYSARFLGPNATYEERFRVILDQLKGLPQERRAARFRCVITIADATGRAQSVEGVVEGVIADAPRGGNGFGYDPIFLLPELGKTTAELSPAHKNLLSHRGRAARLAREVVLHWPPSFSSHEAHAE